ncbi:maleylpyruvate isomerase N-terminal domain-containing protein [Streptomyces sp. NPDC048604]|uniref:maleylpyruvate isomerase N-terminal domain-containing protein n=1 Tax=Streptomyces sp. NPDC048604 TaxID=3365578 RepID=UPI0037104B56
MGTTTFDPVTEHERTRGVLSAALQRLARMLGEVPDLDAAAGVPDWTVGDVGAHLAAGYLAYGAAFTGESMDWEVVVPPGDRPLGERVAAVNALSVSLVGAAERARLGEIVAERGEAFLRATKGLAPDTPVPAPWLGPGVTVPLAAATGTLLGECLVHGLDIARGARRPWQVDPDEARLVIGQSMPTMMPLALNRERARGVRISFDLAVKGGPRLAVVVDDGTATVTRDAPPRRYDCRITAEPTAFLLVSFRRVPLWKVIVAGRMRAGGRRPWLASQLSRLVATP